MEGQAPDPAEVQQVHAALSQFVLDPNGFDDEDIEQLWRGKYRSADCLRQATREGLRCAGLAPARIDKIVRAQERAEAGTRLIRGAARDQAPSDQADLQQVRAALAEAGVDPDEFDDEDIAKLWLGDYRSAGDILGATWEGLTCANLAACPAGIIMQAQARAAAGPGRSGAARGASTSSDRSRGGAGDVPDGVYERVSKAVGCIIRKRLEPAATAARSRRASNASGSGRGAPSDHDTGEVHKPQIIGSCVAMPGGYVATSFHVADSVVLKDAVAVFPQGETCTGFRKVAFYPAVDTALLKPLQGAPPKAPRIGHAEKGDTVICVGYPQLGTDQHASGAGEPRPSAWAGELVQRMDSAYATAGLGLPEDSGVGTDCAGAGMFNEDGELFAVHAGTATAAELVDALSDSDKVPELPDTPEHLGVSTDIRVVMAHLYTAPGTSPAAAKRRS